MTAQRSAAPGWCGRAAVKGVIVLAAQSIAAAMTPCSAAAATDPLSGLAVHHVQVSVRNADRLAAWYVATLGFRVTKRVVTPTVTIVWIDLPGFRLGLAQIAGSVRDPSQMLTPPNDTVQQGYRQIHFSVADVDAAYAALVARGVHFATPPTTYAITGIRVATLLDPELNAISLYEDIDPANPPLGGVK